MKAICTMISKPFNFETWLDYHFSLGFDYIFLRVENTPELENLLSNYPKVIAYYDNDPDTYNNYWTIQDRQINFLKSINRRLVELKIDWVFFNIDCDELICTENLDNILNNISPKYNVLEISNYEAVYPNDNVSNPFLETNTFRFDGLKAYCNGKSAIRVTHKIPTHVPHTFKGIKTKLQSNKICILHFESSTFQRWYDKFKGYINSDDDKISSIPFPFYRNSIEIIKRGDIEEARKFYNQHKVGEQEYTLKLYWTPTLPTKNICWA